MTARSTSQSTLEKNPRRQANSIINAKKGNKEK